MINELKDRIRLLNLNLLDAQSKVDYYRYSIEKLKNKLEEEICKENIKNKLKV